MQVFEIESRLTKFNGCSFTYDQDHELKWDLGLVYFSEQYSFIFHHHHYFPLQVYIHKTFGRYYRVLTMVYNTQRYWVFGLLGIIRTMDKVWKPNISVR
jgi:hypothetical protein